MVSFECIVFSLGEGKKVCCVLRDEIADCLCVLYRPRISYDWQRHCWHVLTAPRWCCPPCLEGLEKRERTGPDSHEEGEK